MLRERLTANDRNRALPRGFRARGWGWILLSLALLCGVFSQAHAQAITRYARLTGNISYVVTGGSLRAADNNVNPCSLNATSTQSLSGVPVGASIRAAYLYWGGSGATIDSSVTLNAQTINASRTFAVQETVTGLNWRFFGGFADVTALVSGNGSFTFGGLTVTNTGNYCGGATASGVVAGWSLIVVYEQASERLRAINVFDGLDYFYGSAITRIADGFRIPSSNIDGKMTVVTWEGDVTNSAAQNGFAEALQLNGNTIGSLSYNSSSQFTPGGPSIATYGVDIDSYDISSFVAPGQTSASALYSSGQDFVLLTAKVVSVTSEPVVDLSLAKSHSGNFAVGTNGAYTLTVSNAAGSQSTDFAITVTDTLPAGLSFVSGSGTGWSCGAAGQVVTCTHAGPVSGGNSLPAISLVVAVSNSAFPSVTNTASVTTSSYDPDTSNNSASDLTTVLGPNLAASTKTVSDLNGGDANPGDTLRYTITLIESAGVAASGVSVSDDVPGNVTNFTVVSVPPGALNSSSGAGTGANGNGLLNVSNINVPANGSVSIVFDVTIASGAPPGATIDNTAAINNPAGTDPTPSAPQIVVSQSQIPSSGTKELYLWSSPSRLYRGRPPSTQAAISVAGGGSAALTMSPNLQTPVTIRGGSGATGNFPIYLVIANTGSSTGNARSVTVTLTNPSTTPTALSTSATMTVPATTTPTVRQFNLNIPSNLIAPAGSTFTLTITNNASSGRSISVTPYTGVNYSRVELNSLSVINVDSVNTFNAAYPGGAATTTFLRGLSTVYVRTMVSDPFGSFDISSATISLLDPTNTTIVNATMTQVADSGAATKTYEYAYAIPANAAPGAWTARITANEGVEGVTDVGVGSFTVAAPMPSLMISKISDVLSDPVNGASNPKRIPASLVRYTITVTNTGPGAVDANSLAIQDVIPADAALYVDATLGPPVEFIDGATSSGLTFNYASHVTFSSTPGGGAPFSYSPTADANGVDTNVTGLRIAPSGTMPGASGVDQPSFVVRFRVRVK